MLKTLFFVSTIILSNIVDVFIAKETAVVSNVEEFDARVKNLQPGDSVILKNGIWNNAELNFYGKGTETKPIVLTVEEKGKVFLEGNSNLRMSGEYLHVEGLVFRNGYTPTTEVIAFRQDKNTFANNSRLTQCVIDRYNNPERQETDTWVAIYGKNNRVDYNHLSGKNNKGVTMIVRLNTKRSQENYHKIDHNYFGPRPRLGSNGGETLRIGTSHFSMTNSKTLVEYNYFDRCSGEHEIISNKSCQNIYKGNVFYECEGTLTMRHGNETMVKDNIFIGNNKPSTGGIRVINEKQTVINNYGIGLKGYRFRGALVIMNGVPNSPLNRYFQVTDSKVSKNTFVNCDFIQLCAGSDKERSAIPINTEVTNNVFYNENKNDVFTVFDDISGIRFNNNIISKNIKSIANTGFKHKNIKLKKNKYGLLIPSNIDKKIGASMGKNMVTKEDTGVSWYAKKKKSRSKVNVIHVKGGLNTLIKAVEKSQAGDIIELNGKETYATNKLIKIKHPLTFKSKGIVKPKLLYEKKSLFEIQNGGSLSLNGLIISGKDAPDDNGNSVISTSKYSMNSNYNLFIDNCEFLDLDVNHSFDAIRIYKNTFADSISIQRSTFKNVTGSVLSLDKETDDIGIYNAEYVILKNNVFDNVGQAALRLYRGGKDESTFGPFLEIDHCVFKSVGNDKRNKYKSAIQLYGVQVLDIKNNIFEDTKGLNMHLVVGEPIVNIQNNNLFNSGKINVTGDEKYSIKNTWNLEPKFKNNSYSLSNESPLKGKGTDSSDLGIVHSK